ncbi:hypothetical protein JCM10296v2_004601 [Rhodotorula toruloides]
MPKRTLYPIQHYGSELKESRKSYEPNKIWGERKPFHGDEKAWEPRVDSVFIEPEEKIEKWVQSCCVLCSNGCAMDVGVKDGKVVAVKGREQDRVNKGRLGPKGMYGWVSMNAEDRLKYPMIRNSETGQLERASWDDALNLMVKKSKELREKYTPHSIAFYTSGQLFLEEYHSLALIGKAGLGTLHMDGNTRLCTATAAAAMRESFGCDGQPGSYTDFDHCDTLFMVGHNMAATQTVLWSRILDRLAGPNPPFLIVMDPRQTSVGHAAIENGGIHLPVKTGTNLCLLNGILKILLENDEFHDKEFIEKHTIGIDALRNTVKDYDLDRVAEITAIPADSIKRAAEAIGRSKRLVSTCLQGVYQSNQATASACAVNNINLIKGAIGREGASVFQFNGQPTAQNNRECGCDGEFPGFRNPSNPDHMKDLAKHWNVDVNQIPHWGQPTHVMSLLKFIENGSIKMLWISGTNPAVSLPDLARIRRLFTSKDLFIVAQDIFPTETTALADVVLPARQWSEKTGCFTNVDRTVHIAYKAVDPPGEAWSDLKIFSEYGRRMGFKDKDGNDLIPWMDEPEKAFDHWAKSTKVRIVSLLGVEKAKLILVAFVQGRPVDYTGLSHAKLTGGSGVQWPCNELNPNGTERLYTDYNFPTTLDMVESYGHDLFTGTVISPQAYKAMNPNGRAILKACHYTPHDETPDKEYPFRLSTGRIYAHFHTRTKTGRSKELEDAAPEPFVQISEEDAEELGIKHGDMCLVEAKRGSIEVTAKVGEIAKGNLFVPFHYGAADQDSEGGKEVRARSANELTESTWDFISKQPIFKTGSVRISKVEGGVQIHAKSGQWKAQEDRAKIFKEQKTNDHKIEEHHRHLEDILGEYDLFSKAVLEKMWELSDKHAAEKEISIGLKLHHKLCKENANKLAEFVMKYGEDDSEAKTDVESLSKALFREHGGSKTYQRLMDLNGFQVLVSTLLGWLSAINPSAQALHDAEFASAIQEVTASFAMARTWAEDHIKVAAPQTLIVPVAC